MYCVQNIPRVANAEWWLVFYLMAKYLNVFSLLSLFAQFFCMSFTGLQSFVNTELARRIAVSSLHGTSQHYSVKSVWATGRSPFMEAVKLSSESWVNTKTGLLTAHLHDDIQNLTFLQRERDSNRKRLLPLQLIFSVAILYHKMEPQVHVVLITGNSALSAQRTPETHNYCKDF